MRNGLADEEGDLLRAFELAKESAGYSRSHLFQLWELPPRSSPLEELVESGWLRASLRESGALRRLGSAYRFLEGLRTFFLMPYQLHIR
ncbi:MAG: hypothetical protein KatS3mg115_0014 [Candidatus Poribacteria bacterium]|nr:MAG: hypothetical protein KatS3mg115_0014 [Candidatus Poribacteria bacterium]